jgi:hypothetical protein
VPSRITGLRLSIGAPHKLGRLDREIMPVYANYGMSRSRATTQYHTGSIVAADFMERVADDYEELDRYASLAVQWGWGFYLRWRTTHEAEMRRAVPHTERRPGRRR